MKSPDAPRRSDTGAFPRAEAPDDVSAPGSVTGRDILALACPDWRGPLFAVDAFAGEILYANVPAIELVEGSRSISVVKDRLVFGYVESQRQYLRALEAGLSGWTDCGVFLLRHPDDREWFSVNVHKPGGLFLDVLVRRLGDSRMAARLVFVEFSTAASQPEPRAIKAFADHFGLTAAESELAALLARGLSLSEIAEKRGIAISTVRQRTKQILAKTGSKRQSDIVRLVMGLR